MRSNDPQTTCSGCIEDSDDLAAHLLLCPVRCQGERAEEREDIVPELVAALASVNYLLNLLSVDGWLARAAENIHPVHINTVCDQVRGALARGQRHLGERA